MEPTISGMGLAEWSRRQLPAGKDAGTALAPCWFQKKKKKKSFSITNGRLSFNHASYVLFYKGIQGDFFLLLRQLYSPFKQRTSFRILKLFDVLFHLTVSIGPLLNGWGNNMGMSRDGIWRLLFVLLLGQMASLLVTIANFTSSAIADLGVDTPLTQCLLVYLSLIVVYGSILLYRRQKLMAPWYWYIMLAIFDVQGSYLGVKAFQYTSITSVTLLSCGIIPWIMVLTWFILRTRYSLGQILGAAICMVGIMVVLFRISDGGGKNPLLGNMLVVAGTLCTTLSIVGEEFCVKKKDQIEVVAMLGLFGALTCMCQIYIFEWKDLASVEWSPMMIAFFAGSTMATVLYYALVPFLLKMSGAALFYLSLLTSNMWAVLIRVFFYREKVDWFYYLALAIVIAGLVIYSLNETTPPATAAAVDAEATCQYEPLPEEMPS